MARLARAVLLGASCLGTAAVFGACAPEQKQPEPGLVALERPTSVHQAIIEGEVCSPDDHPSAVAVLTEVEVNLGGFGLVTLRAVPCTGTLIAPDVVLTAAHCLDPASLTDGFGQLEEERYFVSRTDDLSAISADGTNPLPDDAVEATAWRIHPAFDLSRFQAPTTTGPATYKDLALLFLAEPLDEVPAVVLPEAETELFVEAAESAAVVEIAGWGRSNADPPNPFEPPPEEPLIGLLRCATTTIGELGAEEMEVGPGMEAGRKCHGDSGGPTYLTLELPPVDGGPDAPGPQTELPRLVGVTSHAYDASDCARGGIDTRVDVFRAWIDDELTSGCADGERAWCELPGVLGPEDVASIAASLEVDAGPTDAGALSKPGRPLDAGFLDGGDAGSLPPGLPPNPPGGPPLGFGCGDLDLSGRGGPQAPGLFALLLAGALWTLGRRRFAAAPENGRFLSRGEAKQAGQAHKSLEPGFETTGGEETRGKEAGRQAEPS